MVDSIVNASAVLEVSALSLPDQQRHGETVFPYVIRCESADATRADVERWVAMQSRKLLELAAMHGAVVFRDFALSTAEDFDAFVTALGIPNFPYKKSLSNAVRVNRTERVFSANEAPPEVTIFFHHEMAQTPIYPAKILFFCEIASEEGGATPICRSDVLYERLKEACPQFVENCETKGLQYTNVMPGDDDPKSGMGRSWRSTLEVTTREAAEDRLRELSYSWEWLPDGCLRATTPPLPAVMEVGPGRKTFFNQLIAAFRGWKDSRNDPSEAIRHGDGSKLDADAVQQAVRLAEELAFDVKWQPGDAVLIDNTIVMHARRTFRGTRKVVASLADVRSQSFSVR
ncbi:MAG: TauD/TfdA family dioxygenase [Planctomycetaceae bacterium]|nr:TauD/TfdA family dioxygenase [Planctomycetaceae bacterium]